jgi:hypothetical protein
MLEEKNGLDIFLKPNVVRLSSVLIDVIIIAPVMPSAAKPPMKS